MAALSTFGEAKFAASHHAFDQDTLQDVALACVEGIVSALAVSDTKRALHISERLAAVLHASPLSLPATIECTCQRTMGCAYRRFGDHSKASECFKVALAQRDGEDAFQRVNTLMLLSNSLSSLQQCDPRTHIAILNSALECACEAQAMLQQMLFHQPDLMSVSSTSDNSSAPVQMVRLVVAVHFRVGVLKQQLGNRAGARDALHAIEVSKMILGRFSVGQQMFRIVREDGTLIPVAEQSTMRSLNDNLSITGTLNASGHVPAPAATTSFTAQPQQPQFAASSIYSSASSGLSSLMPRLRVPEPDVTDPTESLHGVSRLLGDQLNAGIKYDWGRQQGSRVVLDGTRDMWRGEFAPGIGRVQLPDVEVEHAPGSSTARRSPKQHVSATALYETWLPQKHAAASRPHNHARDGGALERRSEETLRVVSMNGGDAAWLPQHPRYKQPRAPGSYISSPNHHNAANSSHRALQFDAHVAVPVTPLLPGDAWGHDGGSSVAAVASIRLTDPDVVLSCDAVHSGHFDAAGQYKPVEQGVQLWSEHQASPIVNILHQYLQQQHERVQEANVSLGPGTGAAVTAVAAAPFNHEPLHRHMDEPLQSPRHENDASPVSRKLDHSKQHVDDRTDVVQDDDVAGFLLARTLPESELRLASRFQDGEHDDRMVEFTVDDFLFECASMSSAMEADLRRELEHFAERSESELQREIEDISSGAAVTPKP